MIYTMQDVNVTLYNRGGKISCEYDIRWWCSLSQDCKQWQVWCVT
jgi:hypothetical protein